MRSLTTTTEVSSRVAKDYCTMRKVTQEIVAKTFLKQGLVVLGTYVNSRTPLAYRCIARGHEHFLRYGHVQQGRGCPLCGAETKEKTSGKRFTLSYIKDESLNFGFNVLSTEYINSATPLEVSCQQNHITYKPWDSIKQGDGCSICAGVKKYTLEEVVDIFGAEKWKVLSTKYVNNETPLEVACPYGHTSNKSLTCFLVNQTCLFCAGIRHTEEQKQSLKIAENLTNYLAASIRGKAYIGSKTAFCKELAEQVVLRLGNRPEGHQLDHVIPRSWFSHFSQEQIFLCWSVDNFQWLLEDENEKKRNRLTKKMMMQLTPYQIAIANVASFRPKKQELLMKDLGLWLPEKEAMKRIGKIKNNQQYGTQLDLLFDYPEVS